MDTSFGTGNTQVSHLYIALNRMELALWMPVITVLIHHWQGLEKYISLDELSPLAQLTAVMDDAERCDARYRDLLLRRRLSRLPVYHYRAMDSHGRTWDQLCQSFSDFSRGDVPRVWYDWEPSPSPHIVEQWLSRRLSEHK